MGRPLRRGEGVKIKKSKCIKCKKAYIETLGEKNGAGICREEVIKALDM